MGVGNQSKWRWAAIHKLTQQHYQNQSEKQDDGVDLITGLPKGLNRLRGCHQRIKIIVVGRTATNLNKKNRLTTERIR